MPTQLTVNVALADRGYEIEIGVGTLSGIGTFIERLLEPAHAVLITDQHVSAYAATAVDALAGQRKTHAPVWFGYPSVRHGVDADKPQRVCGNANHVVHNGRQSLCLVVAGSIMSST